MHNIKTKLGKQIDFSRKAADIPEKEMAYKILLKNVNKQIDDSLSLLDKVISSKDAKALKELNKKYSLASDILTNSESALARGETSSGTLANLTAGGLGLGLYGVTKDPVMAAGMMGASLAALGPKGAMGGRGKSTMAAMADKVLNQQSRVPFAPLRGYLGTIAPQNEQLYEGIPESMTVEIDPMEAPMFEDMVLKSPLKPSEKANRINLLRKHGRVLLSQ